MPRDNAGGNTGVRPISNAPPPRPTFGEGAHSRYRLFLLLFFRILRKYRTTLPLSRCHMSNYERFSDPVARWNNNINGGGEKKKRWPEVAGRDSRMDGIKGDYFPTIRSSRLVESPNESPTIIRIRSDIFFLLLNKYKHSPWLLFINITRGYIFLSTLLF